MRNMVNKITQREKIKKLNEFQQYRSMNRQTQNHSQYQKKDENTRSSSALSDEITLQEEKKRKFFIKEAIYLVYFLIRIALTAIILIVVNQNFIQQLTASQEYKRMQENIALWKQDVIINITVVNSYNCPEGYQTYTSYMWPGTKQGCYCYTSLGEWDYIKILQGSCSELAMSAGCRSVPKQTPFPFLFWKKDELICMKRLRNVNFFTDLKVNQINAVTCAPNTNYRMDIPVRLNETLCPITDIDNSTSLPAQLPGVGFSFNRQSSYPIIGIKMTEYEFCPQYDRQNISPFKQRDHNYNLQLLTRTYCPGIDSRVIVIDEIGEDQLFANNPRIDDIVNNLPAYPEPMSDYKYKLGFVRYPEWTYSCRQSEQFRLSTTENNLNLFEINDYTVMCIGFCTAFISVIGALLTAFFIFRKVSEFYYRHQQHVMYDTLQELQRKKPNLYEKLHKKFVTQLIIYLLQLSVGISVLIILAVLFSEIQEYFLWYKDSKSCTSEVMKQWIDTGYMKYFNLQQKNLLLTIILVLSFIIVDTIMFFWRNFKGDLKKQQYEEETNIFDDEVKQLQHTKTNEGIYEIEMQKHKDIEVKEEKYGTIQKNKIQSHQSQMNMTEQSFIVEMDHLPSTTIVRPKRPKRAKALEASAISQGTQQWDF